MPRDKMVTLVIVACMVSAVSTVPALLVSSFLIPPVTNNYYETILNTTNNTTVTPLTNVTVYNNTTTNNYTSNTNVTYNVNGTVPVVERHVFQATVVLNYTRTFHELFNMTLDKKVTFTDIFIKTNNTIPGAAFGSVSIDSRLFLNGTRILFYGCPSVAFSVDGSLNEYLNEWQGVDPNWIFDVNPSKMFQFGITCYDGYNPVAPVSLKVEIFIFYEFEVMAR